MSQQQGFILLHRSIQNHWLYEEKRVFSRYEAFTDLLMMVNHKDNKVLQDGELVEVKRGERITSIRQLMDRWQWSNTKVKKFLDLLQNDNMIEYEVTPKKKTLIKIVKYHEYQGFQRSEQSAKTTQNNHRNDTEQSQNNHREDTEATQNNINNNDNNENNDKNENNDNNINNKAANIFQVYEQNFGMLRELVRGDLIYWSETLSDELVIEAMKIAVKNNVTNFKYCETILKDWANRNVKTLADVQALQLEREGSKPQGGFKDVKKDDDAEREARQSGLPF
ncbi:replication protein [Bacillus phage poppyseed]|uniref:DnaD/DnaB repication protein n=2 Tax=Bacillus phage Page TaxID=1406786 RepID=U5PVJ6_9CAUD|nr:DnaD-like helicase loader [Bacillus phage Page]AGY47959.1 DnaD/DnaB repication protein [Bacillus phage Page]AGY48054.1 replication protein [Bacillus phage poppyseed]